MTYFVVRACICFVATAHVFNAFLRFPFVSCQLGYECISRRRCRRRAPQLGRVEARRQHCRLVADSGRVTAVRGRRRARRVVGAATGQRPIHVRERAFRMRRATPRDHVYCVNKTIYQYCLQIARRFPRHFFPVLCMIPPQRSRAKQGMKPTKNRKMKAESRNPPQKQTNQASGPRKF
jgi:hypothetical protein